MSFPDHPASVPGCAPVPITFEDALPTDSPLVSDCLPYADMADIPASYQAYTRWQHRNSGRRSWEDACPAYALAFLTYCAYGPRLQEAFEWELELQWDELRGASGLEWPEARALVVDAWKYLGCTGLKCR